jgi:ligand-binding SRPBCC domain-containing protein
MSPVETMRIETFVAASQERVFDAARDLDLHARGLAHTNERAIAGRTSGLIEGGEEVTWRGRHFGVAQNFTSRITSFDRPHSFRDTMQRGAFRSFAHDHFFLPVPGGTTMVDLLVFSAPLGILGRIAEKLFLRRYLQRLLTDRARTIKEAAEASCRR